MIIDSTQLNMVRESNIGASIGYASGVFDLFHRGHINYIEECKKNCDILIIGVDSNRLAKQRKGHARPMHDISERMNNVSRHAHYVFAKDAPSECYTGTLCPNFYFFSKDNLIEPEKRRRLAENPNFKDAVFISYTNDISTTEILDNFAGGSIKRIGK